MTNLPGISVLDVLPGQIITFGDMSRIRGQRRWPRVLSVACRGDRVVVRTLGHRIRSTLPLTARVWVWQS